ncbi:hypothetical protein [Gryllotalpicola sp.]|uniref:hypothetical protein n=1 Tax=Gryllotalpicola sp. TaxID=1932787 RepID=UPI002605DE2F|nr:hypothetical protein [Gryllotalpicola sp.]
MTDADHMTQPSGRVTLTWEMSDWVESNVGAWLNENGKDGAWLIAGLPRPEYATTLPSGEKVLDRPRAGEYPFASPLGDDEANALADRIGVPVARLLEPRNDPTIEIVCTGDNGAGIHKKRLRAKFIRRTARNGATLWYELKDGYSPPVVRYLTPQGGYLGSVEKNARRKPAAGVLAGRWHLDIGCAV